MIAAKVSILEILRSPSVPQKEKDRQWETWKFLQLPRNYRRANRKNYENLDYEKVEAFERSERNI